MKHIDSKLIEPIVLQVGAAVQDSQRLELSLSYITTLLVDLNAGALSDPEFEWTMESLGKKTLGRLISAIREFMDLDNEATQVLKEALSSRNFIIHHFFQERSELFLTSDGRKNALSEVRTKRKAMIRAFEILDPVAQLLMKLKGIDTTAIQQKIQSSYEGSF